MDSARSTFPDPFLVRYRQERCDRGSLACIHLLVPSSRRSWPPLPKAGYRQRHHTFSLTRDLGRRACTGTVHCAYLLELADVSDPERSGIAAIRIQPT